MKKDEVNNCCKDYVGPVLLLSPWWMRREEGLPRTHWLTSVVIHSPSHNVLGDFFGCGAATPSEVKTSVSKGIRNLPKDFFHTTEASVSMCIWSTFRKLDVLISAPIQSSCQFNLETNFISESGVVTLSNSIPRGIFRISVGGDGSRDASVLASKMRGKRNSVACWTDRSKEGHKREMQGFERAGEQLLLKFRSTFIVWLSVSRRFRGQKN